MKHNTHLLLPEEIWAALKKIADRRSPKTTITKLLVEGAELVIQQSTTLQSKKRKDP